MSNYIDKTSITTQLFQNLKSLEPDISITLNDTSISFGRFVRDKASFQNLKMLSAIASLGIKRVDYKLYIGELLDESGVVKKYWIKLTKNKKTLKEYHLDHKGAHIHEFQNGQRNKNHKPSTESLDEIAKDILILTQ